MTPGEIVKRTVRFRGAVSSPRALDQAPGTDFAGSGMSPSPEAVFAMCDEFVRMSGNFSKLDI